MKKTTHEKFWLYIIFGGMMFWVISQTTSPDEKIDIVTKYLNK